MKRSILLTLSIYLIVAIVPVLAATDEYATEASTTKLSETKRIAKSLEPMSEEAAKAGTKAYTLSASYETGRKTGDLRSRAEASRVSDREESYGRYHVELTKRGESRIMAGFTYEPRYGSSRVRLKVTHRATVPRRCPIDINVNGTSVVYDWSPHRNGFHTTSWNIGSYLQRGHNEIEVRLSSSAGKMYWFKRIEVSASSDCIYRDGGQGPGPGPGPGPGASEERLRRMYREAQRSFDDGVSYKNQYDKSRARRQFKNCIKKCDRVERETSNYSLRSNARDLRRRANYELQNMNSYY